MVIKNVSTKKQLIEITQFTLDIGQNDREACEKKLSKLKELEALLIGEIIILSVSQNNLFASILPPSLDEKKLQKVVMIYINPLKVNTRENKTKNSLREDEQLKLKRETLINLKLKISSCKQKIILLNQLKPAIRERTFDVSLLKS